MTNIRLALLAVLLSGCTPYVFGGLHYSTEPVNNIGESGVAGTYGAGVESRRWSWLSCEYRHRSMINKKPELVIDDMGCQVKMYLRRH